MADADRSDPIAQPVLMSEMTRCSVKALTPIVNCSFATRLPPAPDRASSGPRSADWPRTGGLRLCQSAFGRDRSAQVSASSCGQTSRLGAERPSRRRVCVLRVIRSRRLRPSRSSFHTISVSPGAGSSDVSRLTLYAAACPSEGRLQDHSAIRDERHAETRLAA